MVLIHYRVVPAPGLYRVGQVMSNVSILNLYLNFHLQRRLLCLYPPP